ncbi:MAG: pilin [Candidatus Falkowbacteria bacterium]
MKSKIFIMCAMLTIVLFPVARCHGFLEGAKTEFEQVTLGSDVQVTPLQETIGKIIGVVLGLLGVILIVLIIYAGFLWMTAGGEQKQVDKAKDYIKNAVMGLVIILLAYAITDFVIDKLTLVQTTGAQ